jgi:hypothetical protein
MSGRTLQLLFGGLGGSPSAVSKRAMLLGSVIMATSSILP